MISRSSSRIIFSSYPRVFNRKYIQTVRYNFCQLPKPSRFARQLGLENKFQILKKAMDKHQQGLVRNYNIVIWGLICIGGSLLMVTLVSTEVRSKIYLTYSYVKLCIRPSSIAYRKNALNGVIKHQQQFYINRKKFTDSVSMKIIEICTKQVSNIGQLDKIQPLIMHVLYLNLRNTKNNTTKYGLYKIFLQRLNKNKQQDLFKDKKLIKIIMELVQKSDLQMLYMITKLKIIQQIEVNNEIKKLIKNKIAWYKKQIQKCQNEIKQISEQKNNYLLQPYLFDCNIRKNWIKYIQNYL